MGLTSFHILFFTLMSCISIPRSDANTGHDLICKDENSRRPCCLHSVEPMNWSEAHTYCHSRQGWLLNSIDSIPLNMDAAQVKQLVQTNSFIWSGYHIREHRLLADNFPIPTSSGEFNSQWVNLISGECVQLHIGTCETVCRTEKKFSSCGTNLHFICVFEHSFDLSKATSTHQPRIEVESTSLNVGNMENGEYRISKPNDYKDSINVTDYETTEHSLTIKCVVPESGQVNEHLQTPVIYNFGVPLATAKVKDDGQDYWIATEPVLQQGFVYLFRCDIFNPRNNTILQSPPVFVRFADDVIISARVIIKREDISWQMLKQSLLDRWEGFNRKAPFMTGILLLMKNLGLNIRPMIFTPGSHNGTAKLVMLVLVSHDGFDTVPNEQDTTIVDTEEKINQAFTKRHGILAELSNVILHNVHKCLHTDELAKQLNPRCFLDNQPMFSPTCERDRIMGFEYKPTKVNTRCDCSETTGISNQLWCAAKDPLLPVGNFSSIINDIKNITSQRTEPLKAEIISIFADIFNRSSKYSTLPDSTIQNCMDIIDIISRSPIAILNEAQEENNATQKILKSLESIGTQVKLENGHQQFVSETMAVDVWNLTYGGNVSNTIGLKIPKSSMKDLKKGNVIPVTSDEVDFEPVESSISLQEKYVKSLIGKSNISDVRLIMKAYTNTGLFQVTSQQNRCNQTRSPNETCYRINSGVVSMQLFVDQQRQTVLNPYHVTFGFSPLENIPDEQRLKNSLCVYWNFSANQDRGDWSSDGCYYDRTEKGKDVCKCNHLTNFAVIMSYYDQGDLENKHDVVLGIISILGLSLSIFGLSLSILSFLLIKSLRDGLPQKLMFQLSLSLLLSWIVFLAGIQRTSSHVGCLVVAALLHYLILASFMWMLGQGILQHMLIVQILKAVSSKFITIYTVIAWGVPIFPVVSVLAIDPELYKGGKNYCWMKTKALYYSFALPVGLIVITNIIIFIRVIIRLHQRGRVGARVMQQGNQTLVNVRASIISFFILGLSWTFGFFAVDDARVYFQYLFCILVSIQGFLIFAMMVFCNHKFQHYWKSVFSCCFKARATPQTGSADTNMGTTDETNPYLSVYDCSPEEEPAAALVTTVILQTGSADTYMDILDETNSYQSLCDCSPEEGLAAAIVTTAILQTGSADTYMDILDETNSYQSLCDCSPEEKHAAALTTTAIFQTGSIYKNVGTSNETNTYEMAGINVNDCRSDEALAADTAHAVREEATRPILMETHIYDRLFADTLYETFNTATHSKSQETGRTASDGELPDYSVCDTTPAQKHLTNEATQSDSQDTGRAASDGELPDYSECESTPAPQHLTDAPSDLT